MIPLERKWLFPVLIFCCVSTTVVFLVKFSTEFGSRAAWSYYSATSSSQLAVNVSAGDDSEQQTSPDPLPVFAYLITGSKGDGNRMKRLLLAVYHPRNEYLLHLDMESPPRERADLGRFIRLNPIFSEVGNVHMVARSNLVTYRGPTMTSTYLHCLAILLRQRTDWDWFINLSASDYPLVTQDDIIHVFSFLPRDLNFVDHTSNIGGKEYQRARPIVVDPAIYSVKKADLLFATQHRTLPTSFKLYQGEAWVILSRAFSEFTIYGWDNLPRLLLMYFANFVSSPEGYFHTVICNSPEFKNTTVNNDLRHIQWHRPAQQHPMMLTLAQFDQFNSSGDPFARKFGKDSEALDKIDRELLNRSPHHFTPGGWCIGKDDGRQDPCWVKGNPDVLKPTAGTVKLQQRISYLLEPTKFRDSQCK